MNKHVNDRVFLSDATAVVLDGTSGEDPLLAMIKAYRSGIEAFDGSVAHEDEAEHETYADATYGWPMDALEAWGSPAETEASAVEALRLALDESREFNTPPMVESMIAAALGYFDPKGTIPAENCFAATSTKIEVAHRVHHLSSVLSKLLDDLDGANWYVRVSPTFMGQPNYHVEPVKISPALQLERGLLIAEAALAEMQPGRWVRAYSLDKGFASITFQGDEAL